MLLLEGFESLTVVSHLVLDLSSGAQSQSVVALDQLSRLGSDPVREAFKTLLHFESAEEAGLQVLKLLAEVLERPARVIEEVLNARKGAGWQALHELQGIFDVGEFV